MNQSEKLDRFLAAIYAEGEAARSRLAAEAQEQRAQALAAAEHAALQAGYDCIHRELARIRTTNGNRISRTVLDCRRSLSAQTETLTAALFAQVEQDILSFTVTPAYPAALQALWAQMLPVLNEGDITLYLRSEDTALGEALFPAFQRELGDFRLGGLIARSGNRWADASYDTALREAKRTFIEEVTL
jgi:ATP synthase (E/31 kDa) subunit.